MIAYVYVFAVITDGQWQFAGIALTSILGFVALFVRQGRAESQLTQINRAVNHRPDGAPTLVERVGIIENETTAHRAWELEVFTVIAKQVGCELPPYPKGEP